MMKSNKTEVLSFDGWFGEASQNKLFWESPSKASKMGFEAGQQSKQAEIDELKARADDLEKQLVIVLDEYYMEGSFSTRICNEAEKVLDKEDRLNDSWYVKHVKPYSE